MAVLNGQAIAARLGDGDPETQLIITPFFSTAELLPLASSVDLRLGCRFAAPRRDRVTHIGHERLDPAQLEEFYVPLGANLVVHPRQFLLATTLEWIRLPRDLSGSVVGRSRLGRRGLIVATATGVHPTFSGVLTLEITNLAEVPLSLSPGQAVCQLVLSTIDGPIAPGEQPSVFLGSLRPTLGDAPRDSVAGFLSSLSGRAGREGVQGASS